VVDKPEDSIDHKPDYWVEAEPFDWDEALEFHEALSAVRLTRKQREHGNRERRLSDEQKKRRLKR